MNYQKIIIVGNLTDNANLRKSKQGDTEFMTFNVAVNENKTTTFFSVTAFSQYLLKIAAYLTKGREVLVEGKISVNEKKFFNIIANNIQLGNQPKEKSAK